MKRTSTATWHEKYNRWQINVQKDGVRRSFYSSIPGRAGQRECNKKADDWLDDNIEDENSRVKDLWEQFIAEIKLTTSAGNARNISYFGDNWIIPSIGRFKISIITENHLQEIIIKGYEHGLSKKTLIELSANIKKFIKYCRRIKVTTLLPESLYIPKGAKTKEKRIVQPDGFIILFRNDKITMRRKEVTDFFINAYRFQALTGLRPGELIALKQKNIIGNTVYIKNAINVHGEETKGKNDNAIRHFALSELAQTVVQAQLDMLSSVGMKSDFLFPGENGEALLEQTYRRRWKRFCDYNNIPYVTPYELRHTFVSVAKNLPEGRVKTLVGHSRNMDTFGVYGHELDGELQKTASDLNTLFNEILSKNKPDE